MSILEIVIPTVLFMALVALRAEGEVSFSQITFHLSLIP